MAMFFSWGVFSSMASGYSIIVRGNKFGFAICLCSLFVVTPTTFFFHRLRGIVGSLPPHKISHFLFINVIVTGVSSLLPMLYLASQSIACIPTVQLDKGETYYSKCSGISYPVFSINISLLAVLLFKVVIAPLSNTTITVQQILSMNVPNILKFELGFAGMSFCCNLILFGRIEEGKANGATQAILGLAVLTLILALFLELAFMVLFRRSAGGRRSTVAGDVKGVGMADLGGIVGGFT